MTLTEIGDHIFVRAPALEWRLVLFRIAASPVVALLVAYSRNRVPYWETAVGFLLTVLVANLLFLHPLRQGRYLLVAALSTFLDLVLLLVISNLVVRGSATQESTTELWLIYPLVILIGSYRFRPLFSVLNMVLLTTWYGAHVAIFFPAGARPLTELPVRVGFFLLIGALGTAVAHALRGEGRARK